VEYGSFPFSSLHEIGFHSILSQEENYTVIILDAVSAMRISFLSLLPVFSEFVEEKQKYSSQ
jgi:hypothetical protein